MAGTDQHGNSYNVTVSGSSGGNSAVYTGYNNGGVIYGGGGGTVVGGGGGQSPYSINWPITASTASIQWFPEPVTPNKRILEDPAVFDKLVERMLTLAPNGEKIVVCVDVEWSPSEVRDLADGLCREGISAIVIPGARAGSRCVPGFRINPEDKRIDVLARIAELWEQRPDLKLTDLFQWYAGANMDDEDFARCTELHFKKITEHGI